MEWTHAVNYAIGVVGVLGNSLIIFLVLYFKRIKSQYINKLILNQSVIDLIASLCILEMPSHDYSMPSGLPFWVATGLCSFWKNHYLLWSLLMCSTYNLVAISVDRYIAATKILEYRAGLGRKYSSALAVFAWVFGFAFNVLVNSLTARFNGKRCVYWNSFPSPFWQTVTGVSVFVIQFLIPLLIFVLVYFFIMKSLRSKVKPASDKTPTSERNQQRLKNVNQTLASVIIACIVCNSLNQIIFLGSNFGLKFKFYGDLHNTSIVLMLINSCVNPFIYMVKYKLFRSELMSLVRPRPTETMSSITY